MYPANVLQNRRRWESDRYLFANKTQAEFSVSALRSDICQRETLNESPKKRKSDQDYDLPRYNHARNSNSGLVFCKLDQQTPNGPWCHAFWHARISRWPTSLVSQHSVIMLVNLVWNGQTWILPQGSLQEQSANTLLEDEQVSQKAGLRLLAFTCTLFSIYVNSVNQPLCGHGFHFCMISLI